jgi:hypothetical protein
VKPKLLAILLAVAMTAANALKPPVIDDTAYLALARQISHAPFDPYGFEQFWYQQPQPANEILAPPVLSYWLDLGMRLVGDDPVALKLWLFPFALVFCLAVQFLLRRFAPGVENPALVMTALSPAILPAFNFMLDVPAYALNLTAVAVFLRALDRRSVALAVVAGLIAGLAAQTKYTGLLVPGVFVAASVLRRQLLPGLVACAVAAGVFAGWEALVAAKYGDSHFLLALRGSQTTLSGKLQQVSSLPMLLGATAPPVALLALIALRIPWGIRLGFVVFVIAAYVLMAAFADPAEATWGASGDIPPAPIATRTFAVMGFASIAVILAVVLHLVIRFRRRPIRMSWESWLLVAWLLIEVGGYFAMAQFPAVRRVIGMTLVATILVARVAAFHCRGPRRRAVWLAAVPGVVLGMFYAIVDISSARVEPEAVRQAAAVIREKDIEPTIWFTGHWGFQYEAVRQGMKPLVPGRSLLQAGDWLVVPAPWLEQQRFVPAPQQGEPVAVLKITRWFPLRTVPAYYGGELPMEPCGLVRLEIEVYRINAAWVPEQP